MSDENFNASQGQTNTSDSSILSGGNISSQDGGQNQFVTEERLKAAMNDVLNTAYRKFQSVGDRAVSQSEARVNAIIADFQKNMGVNLSKEQAEQIAARQNQQTQAQSQPMPQAQMSGNATDPEYERFLYYHGFRQSSKTARQMYDIQNSMGVKLMADDPEYKERFGADQKFNSQDEFISAWRNALMDKALRMRNANNDAQQPNNQQKPSNMGQLPLVGSKGKKSNEYDPKRSSKSMLDEYYKSRNLR